MIWAIGIAVVLVGVAALVLLVKWQQRCPRCQSMSGPTGVRGRLVPDGRYQVTRTCRRCGHTWQEETKYDDVV